MRFLHFKPPSLLVYGSDHTLGMRDIQTIPPDKDETYLAPETIFISHRQLLYTLNNSVCNNEAEDDHRQQPCIDR